MLKTIRTYGVDCDDDRHYYIFAIGFSGTKVYFTENGTWSELKEDRAESEDFKFVYEEFCSLQKEEAIISDLEASLIF